MKLLCLHWRDGVFHLLLRKLVRVSCCDFTKLRAWLRRVGLLVELFVRLPLVDEGQDAAFLGADGLRFLLRLNLVAELLEAFEDVCDALCVFFVGGAHGGLAGHGEVLVKMFGGLFGFGGVAITGCEDLLFE